MSPRAAHIVALGVLLLGGGCVRRPVALPSPAVDVLDFVIGDAGLWPRFGTQTQNQIVDFDKREVCWSKYGNRNEFECWRWDDAFVYHEVDHAVDGRPGESYRFSDGRWLPRHLSVGRTWSLDLRDNRQTWFLPTCAVDPANSHPFPYRLRASVLPARNLGPDLQVREVLVLEYAPYAPGKRPEGEPERFCFARGAGWFKWSSARGVAVFDRLGGRSVGRSRYCGEP
jgi:hypothetical protein